MRDPNGMFVPLQDAQGRALRFVGDPAAALDKERAAATQTLERMQPIMQEQDRADARRRQLLSRRKPD